MKLLLVGPGRAGRSVFLGALAAGHNVVGVTGRDLASVADAADELDATAIGWGDILPPCDVAVLAVRDDAIGEVATFLAPLAGAVAGAVHLSGLTPAGALAPLAAICPIGSFHPLQTLPDPRAGAVRLQGAWVGITSDDDFLADQLFRLARSMGSHPFELFDEAKALYHAAAAAAANYPIAAFAMARRLFEAAGVPFEAAGPLVRAVVDNTFEIGPEEALTGPIARGDVGTVEGQRSAVEVALPDLLEDFLAFGRAVAKVAGTTEEFGETLR